MSARALPDREIRLRRRLDFAIAERDLARSQLAILRQNWPWRIVGRCVYCGARTRAIACGEHHALLSVDPHYNQRRPAAVQAAA